MTTSLRSTLDFLLYDWLQAGSLTARARFADHSREFGRILATTTSMGAIPRYLIEAIAFGGIILLALFLMVQYQDAQNGALTHVLPLLGFYAFFQGHAIFWVDVF